MKVNTLMQDRDTLALSRAILLYESKGDSGDGGKAATALATLHDVVMQGEKPEIAPGQLLDATALHQTLRRLQGLPQHRDVMPARMLFLDGSRMCWYIPSSLRAIWFSERTCKDFARQLNGRIVLHPALLFMAQPGMLSVWALDTDERPTAASPVYRAPYYNIYDSGAMCRGNVALPRGVSVADVPVWEQGFFDTQFTHSNYSGPVCLHKQFHDGMWRALAWRDIKRGFPTHYLKPCQQGGQAMTLDHVLNGEVTPRAY